jgi:hypothetical protein
MKRHDRPQGKTRNDNQSQRFISNFCELTGQLSKLEWRPQQINEDPQTEEPYLSDKLK